MAVDPLERLVAHDEIRQLASRYAVAVDSRDLDSLVDLFVDDVRVGRDADGTPLHPPFAMPAHCPVCGKAV